MLKQYAVILKLGSERVPGPRLLHSTGPTVPPRGGLIPLRNSTRGGSVFKNTFAISSVLCLTAAGLAGQMAGYSPAGWLTATGQPVFGEIQNLHISGNDLMVVLSGVSDGRPLQRVAVDGGGTFQLNGVLPGNYVVRIVRPPDEVITEQVVQIGAGQNMVLRLPETPAQSRAATISADQLHHPLSGKAAKMLHNAESYSAAGNHAKAIEELKHALKEPSAAGYAHAILGTEYLKTGQLAPAQAELEQAVQVMPHDAILHSNLGYALLLGGDGERAEREVRKALEIDQNNSAARRLLGYILKTRSGESRGR